MFEDTNQTEVNNDSVFDNADFEDSGEEFVFSDTETDESENLYADDGDTNQSGGNEGSPERHEIVYNGQKLSLTLDELKTNAQKGMNYDHVHSQLMELRNSPAFGVIEEYAKKSGMTTEQYVEHLKKLDTFQKVSQMTDEGVPEPYARRLIELEEKDKARSERDAAEQKRANEATQYNKFLKEYPDVKASDIPEEVWQRFNDGMELVASYAIYENRQLKNQVQQYRQNEANKQKSVGSVTGDSSDANSDAFLEGLFG